MAHSPDTVSLRQHVHKLLYNYAIHHLAYGHIEFTEQVVSEILSQCLHQVPLTDSFSLRPPPEPFEVLTRITGLDAHAPYHELPEKNPAALEFIKREFAVLKSTSNQKPRSERAAYSDEGDDEMFFPSERIFHVISRRARRETPRPGGNTFLRKLPNTSQEFLLKKPLRLKPVPSVSCEDDALQSTDKTLNLTWNLTPEMLSDVSTLLKSTASLSKPSTSYKNQHLDLSSQLESPPRTFGGMEREYTPIFPRSARPGFRRPDGPEGKKPTAVKVLVENSPHTSAKLPPVSMGDLATGSLKQVPVKEFKKEKDLHRQNLIMINGWQAYSSSPSGGSSESTPASSQEEVDQLQLSRISSPITSPTLEKMGQYVLALSLCAGVRYLCIHILLELPAIARTHRIDGAPARKKVKPLGAGKTFAAFLLNALPVPGAPPNVASATNETSIASVLGEPPSIRHDDDSIYAMNTASGSDDEILGFFTGADPKAFILDEKLDEKDAMMMDIPRLPPPNEHATSIHLPKKLLELVLPTKADRTSNSEKQAPAEPLPFQYLKKAKGTQGATLAVSWVPFTISHRLPSHMEMVSVATDQLIDRDDIKNGISREQISEGTAALLNEAFQLGDTEAGHTEVWERMWNSHADSEIFTRHDSDCYDIILTREERRRLQGMDSIVERHRSPATSPVGKSASASLDASYDGRVMVTDYHTEAQDLDSSDKENEDPQSSQRPMKRARILERDEHVEPDTHLWNGADDSGIALDSAEKNRVELPECDDTCALDAGMDVTGLTHLQDTAEPRSRQPLEMPHDYSSASLDPSYAATTEIAGAEPDFLKISVPSLEPDRLHISAGIAKFAELRAKKLSNPVKERQDDALLASRPIQPPETDASLSDTTKGPPHEILTQSTILFPSPWTPPTSAHWYMASMELLQKQAVVRSLRSNNCAIGLVEREGLNGVDLILDPHTAIVFTNLLALPAGCEALLTAISDQSWRYSRLLLIFEAYPPSTSFRCNVPLRNEAETFNAYSPPVLKAIRKFRRDLSMAEACGKKNAACVVCHAFANDVEQAAVFARHFGDLVEANDDSGGALWGDRSWLEEDVPEEEEGMAIADGMNHFAAFVILCQVNVQEFLDMSSDQRLLRFGPHAGHERLATLNQFIEKRLQTIQSSDDEMPH
ncbi:hypothetical protein VNI00_007490 [Paramarasmius palmivorus]|uniref:Uncharacterized protein n=1 Tax=Paramarasmius palmivorus TaxID=297713 RepID=A0AAW0D689_9AGAR